MKRRTTRARFAALSDEEDVGVMVCDSAAQSVHLLLKTAAEDASAARRERIAVIGGSEETVAQMVNRAKLSTASA